MSTLKKLMTLLSKEGLVEQRADIIAAFTHGRTSSAKELKLQELDELCRVLDKNSLKLDQRRKRVIAAQFGVFELMRKKVTIAYVIGCICRRASVDNINEISPNKLDNIYNSLLDAQKQLRYSDRIVKAHLMEQRSYN